MNETLLTQYDMEVEAAKAGGTVPDAELRGEDIDSLMAATIDLCEGMDSTAEMMQRFMLVCDVMYLRGTE